MLKFSSRLWAIAGLLSLSQWSSGFALADSKAPAHDDHHTNVPAAKAASQVPPPVAPVEVAPLPNAVHGHNVMPHDLGPGVPVPAAQKKKTPELPSHKFGDPAQQIYYPPYSGSPPPGNLGRTYQVRTRLIPEDKHPRTGMVEMRLPEDTTISSQGLKATWTGDSSGGDWGIECQAQRY